MNFVGLEMPLNDSFRSLLPLGFRPGIDTSYLYSCIDPKSERYFSFTGKVK